MKTITFKYWEAGDWVQILIDGELWNEGHSIHDDWVEQIAGMPLAEVVVVRGVVGED